MIELATQIVILASLFSGNGSSAPATTQTAFAVEPKQAVGIVLDAEHPLTLEMHVREYFKDAPILAEISRCESRFRHIGKNGKIIRGEANPADIGVMQVNEEYHLKQASELGFNLYSLEGNMGYAKYLYNKEGTRPWSASAPCWKHSGTDESTGRLAKM